MKVKEYLIIESVCDDGRNFRPSDWIERIAGAVGEFGPDHRLHYLQSVRPAMIDGKKCLIVNTELAKENPKLYEFVTHFVEINRLQKRIGEVEEVS